MQPPPSSRTNRSPQCCVRLADLNHDRHPVALTGAFCAEKYFLHRGHVPPSLRRTVQGRGPDCTSTGRGRGEASAQAEDQRRDSCHPLHARAHTHTHTTAGDRDLFATILRPRKIPSSMSARSRGPWRREKWCHTRRSHACDNEHTWICTVDILEPLQK